MKPSNEAAPADGLREMAVADLRVTDGPGDASLDGLGGDASTVCTPAAGALLPAELDPAFGSGGIVTTGFGKTRDTVFAMVRQPDGKILQVGTTNPYFTASWRSGEILLARYLADGQPDPTFGHQGRVLSSIDGHVVGRAVALQPDGKIVVAANTQLEQAVVLVARYLPDGRLDPCFGGGWGFVRLGGGTPGGVAVQPDGKIVVVGSGATGIVLTRLEPGGTLDAQGFGTNGQGGSSETAGLSGASALVLQPDGKIVVTGYGMDGSLSRLALARFQANGILDPGFGTNGLVRDPVGAFGGEGLDLSLQSDGRLLVAGRALLTSTNRAAVLLRCQADGTRDPTFGTDGLVQLDSSPDVDELVSLALAADGKVTAGGALGGSISTAARFNADGTLDTDWDGDGMASGLFPAGVWLTDLVLGSAGTLYASGTPFAAPTPDALLTRRHPDGSLDTSFGTAGLAANNSEATRDRALHVRLTTGGEILALGESVLEAVRQAVMAKYTAAGALDPSFGTGGKRVIQGVDWPGGFATLPGGGFLVWGHVSSSDLGVARYQPSGALDPSFGTGGTSSHDPPGGEIAVPSGMGLDASGNILLAGYLLSSSFLPTHLALLRLKPDGAPDTSFGSGGWVVTSLGSGYHYGGKVAPAPDGKIVFAARLNSIPTLLRYNGDGTLDTSFDGDGIFSSSSLPIVSDLVVQPDGAVLVAGFKANSLDLAVARLTSAGQLDPTFGAGGVATETLDMIPSGNALPTPALARLPDGRLILVGAAAGQTVLRQEMLALGYTTAGILDPTFGTGGRLRLAGEQGFWCADDVAVQPDGKIVLAGRGFSAESGVDFAVVRLIP